MKSFDDGYKALPESLRAEVRLNIMFALEWGLNLFYKKKSGQRRIKNVEGYIIKIIFKKYGIDAETGKVTNKSKLPSEINQLEKQFV